MLRLRNVRQQSKRNHKKYTSDVINSERFETKS